MIDADPVHRDATLTITRTFHPPGLRLRGEVDMSNAAAFERVLAAYAAVGTQPLHLDMSGVSFIDVAGMRVVARTASRLGERTLHLYGVGYAPRTVLRATGWASLPNLVVCGGDG